MKNHFIVSRLFVISCLTFLAFCFTGCSPFKLYKQNNSTSKDNRFTPSGTVTLKWDTLKTENTGVEDSRVVGYYVYYGTQEGNYTTRINAGNKLSVEIKGLVSGTRYYFAVSAYSEEQETVPLNELKSLPVESKIISTQKSIASQIASIEVASSLALNFKVDLLSCVKAEGFYLFYGSDSATLDHRIDYSKEVSRIRVAGLSRDLNYNFILVPYSKDKVIINEAKLKSLSVQTSKSLNSITSTSLLSAQCP